MPIGPTWEPPEMQRIFQEQARLAHETAVRAHQEACDTVVKMHQIAHDTAMQHHEQAQMANSNFFM